MASRVQSATKTGAQQPPARQAGAPWRRTAPWRQWFAPWRQWFAPPWRQWFAPRVRGIAPCLLGLAACTGSAVPPATAADAQRAALSRPETTLSELERGRELYLGRCSACHQPIPPASIPAAEWPEHVGEMKERARLSADEEQLILLYLVTVAERPAAPAQ